MNTEEKNLPKLVQDTGVAFAIPDTESLGALKDLREDFSLTMKYKDADEWASLKDKEVRAFYMGMKEIPNDNGEAVNCGVFVTDTECFLSGQLTLVEAVKVLSVRTPVSITYKGKRNNKSSEGSTMIFDVSTLK